MPQTGRRPDYRFSLANERTFLAYIRTALALLAGGVAVVQLVPEFGPPAGRHALSVLLIGLSIAVSGTSYRRWRRNEAALAADQPLPQSRIPLLVAAGLLAVCVLALALAVVEFTVGTP